MKGANLRFATMTGTLLCEANLTGADLTGCEPLCLPLGMLRGANLAGARLDEITMTGAILDDNGGTHTNLESATLMKAVCVPSP